MTATSVFPDWMAALPMQQQSVMLLAARGPDGVGKFHACKSVVRAYRGTVLKAAKYGRPLRYGEAADTFMSLDRFANNDIWSADLKAFFDSMDELPHHYYLHLLHGAEIVGFKHPQREFRLRWSEFYWRGCEDMHLGLETEAELDQRLSDWHREHWESQP